MNCDILHWSAMNATLRRYGTAFLEPKSSDTLCVMFLDDAKYSIVGSKMEWPPELWFEYEKEKIVAYKKLIIINILGRLQGFSKRLQEILPDLEIQVYDVPEISWSHFAREVKEQHEKNNTIKKDKCIWSSIGVMRLNRFVFLQVMHDNLANICYPSMSQDKFNHLCYEVEKISESKFGSVAKIPLQGKRVFGKVKPHEFNILARKNVQSSLFNICATQPCVDYYVQRHDEKFFTSVCDEVIPIFLNEPNANKESILGFKSYNLQSIQFENESNPVMRWKRILESNKEALTNFDFGKSVYESNIETIKNNKAVLYDTDWKKLANNKIQELPSSIIDIVNSTNMKEALLYVY